MKSIHQAMAMSFLILMLAASSVFAQAERRVAVDIPFQFTVGEKTLPAGEYTIEPNRRDSELVWVLRAANGDNATMLVTNPIRSNRPNETSKLVFRRYDGQYFLAQVWKAGRDTGRELPVVGIEKALELASLRMRNEYVVVASK